jgi:CheY-like chemotaxis protein
VPSEPIFVNADLTRLGQVFANLLNNATKFSERGGHIRLAVECEGTDAVVRITDTGIGIAADMLHGVFQMFSQVDHSIEKSHGGLGIGLSLVKQLVEMHGGSVEAKSAGYGHGSEFIVRLPIDSSATPEVSPAHLEPKASGAPEARRILVADDNADAADSLATLLTFMGHEVRTAADGVAAVELATTFRPDVMLLDIGMPKLNGHDACRRIREEPWSETAVFIALTGWGQDEVRRQSLEAGFDHHLVKPVNLASLMELLASLPTVTP